jgi:hypothetical protein
MELNLDQFYGTEQYYKHPFTSSVYTDGVKYFAETAGAYWFLDIVFSEYTRLFSVDDFLSITLKVGESGADISVTDGNENIITAQSIAFTDCPKGEYKFFYTNGVLMLTTEY